MIELMQELPSNVLGLSAKGKVTGEDYESVIIPAVEAKLAEFEKLRLLYHAGEGFSGYDLSALWDDAKVGMRHPRSWERIAIVSDVDWLRMTMKALSFAMPCPVRIFNNAEFDKAKVWIAE